MKKGGFGWMLRKLRSRHTLIAPAVIILSSDVGEGNVLIIGVVVFGDNSSRSKVSRRSSTLPRRLMRDCRRTCRH